MTLHKHKDTAYPVHSGFPICLRTVEISDFLLVPEMRAVKLVVGTKAHMGIDRMDSSIAVTFSVDVKKKSRDGGNST